MGDINQIVDVQIQVKDSQVSRAGFGVPAIIYSRDKVTSQRVFTFTDPNDILTESDLSELTETSEVYKMAVELFNIDGFTIDKFKIIVRDIGTTSGSAETFTVALDDAEVKDKDFYCLLMPERGTVGQTDNEAVGAWVKSRVKIFLTASNDEDIKDNATSPSGTDLSDVFKNDGNGRTFVIYNSSSDKYPDCNVAGRNLPFNPGSVNWKFTQFKTTIADDLTTSNRLVLDGDGDRSLDSKNTNYVEKIGGVTILSSSAIMSDGLFIDVVRGVDWLEAEMSADIYAYLLDNPKIPFTNDGIASIESIMRKSLGKGVANDVILGDFVISVPDSDEVTDSDRSNRRLTGITFTANLTGAINFVQIRGTVFI